MYSEHVQRYCSHVNFASQHPEAVLQKRTKQSCKPDKTTADTHTARTDKLLTLKPEFGCLLKPDSNIAFPDKSKS